MMTEIVQDYLMSVPDLKRAKLYLIAPQMGYAQGTIMKYLKREGTKFVTLRKAEEARRLALTHEGGSDG